MTARVRFPWVRRWTNFLGPPVDTQARDWDFLATEPRPKGQTLADLETAPCLVLLGEPGMGKSTAIDDERERLCQAGAAVLHYDLKDAGDEGRLVSRLFDYNEPFQAFLAGQGELYLFLDSLDEGQIQLPTLASILAGELRDRCADPDVNRRLRLRIACRSWGYPKTFTRTLQDVFGDSNVLHCRLLPLVERDIALAAKTTGLDEELFLRNVEEQRAKPLAEIPITLDLLLKLAAHGGNLPNRRLDLYEEGCLELCRERSQSRLDKGKVKPEYLGRLSASQRRAVAGRIAAFSVFCQRLTVSTEELVRWETEGALTPRDLTGREVVDGITLEVGEGEVLETLRFPLFQLRGPDRYSWAHQTYAEFLAARYLKTRGVEANQIDALFEPPSHHGGRIAPQLSTTAGWLASMDHGFFRRMVESDPDTLLNGDVAAMGDADKADLTASLFRAYNDGRVHHRWYEVEALYRPLDHPCLPDLLRRVIGEASSSLIARRAALEMANVCGLRDLEAVLLERALDISEEHVIRCDALRALSRIAGPSTLSALVPLALGRAGDDPDDELKAGAIGLTWPGVLTTAQLLSSLSPPKDPRLIGRYNLFLKSDFIERLPDADLGLALQWFRTIVRRSSVSNDQRQFRELREICVGLLRLALSRLEDKMIKKDLAQLLAEAVQNAVWLTELLTMEDDVGETLSDNRARRSLLSSLVSLGRDLQYSWFVNLGFARREDFNWLVQKLSIARSMRSQSILADLVLGVFDRTSSEQFETVYRVAEKVPSLSDRLQRILYCKINDEVAQYWRRENVRKKKLAKAEAHKQPRETINVIICNQIQAFAKDKLNGWCRVIRSFESDHMEVTDVVPELIEDFHGWQSLEPATRSLILKGARDFVLNGDPASHVWWHTSDRISVGASSGMKAMMHVMRHDPVFIARLDESIWQKWAPALIGASFNNPIAERCAAELYGTCFRTIPSEFIRVLKERVEILLASGGGRLDWQTLLKDHWNELLAQVVLAAARDVRLDDRSLSAATALLLARAPDLAGRLLEEAIGGKLGERDEWRSRSGCVIGTVMADKGGQRWGQIWPKLRDDRVLARSTIQWLLSAVGGLHSLHAAEQLTALSEEDLADLHIFLAREYPGESDVEEGSVGPVTEADWVRGSILRRLVTAGSTTGLAALMRIQREAPGYQKMDLPIIEAKENLRRRSWRPPSPSDLKALLDRGDRRLVRSGEELLQVLIDSLRRLNVKLQGETPRASQLWNISPGRRGHGRPKDENDLSDYVKGHLEDDLAGRLVGIQREVEIRRPRKSVRGQRTDIHLTAHIPRAHEETFDQIKVIIEVKGCWNGEIKTAMKEQLLDRYMVNSNCIYGVYLVGWFCCEAWASDDTRQGSVPRWTYEDAKQFFAKQASGLSTGERSLRSVMLDCRIR